MRPGPGLVVMALAFISGARRGTTQIISSSQGSRLGHSSGDDDSGALVRINPWLSACDLAQPKTAPDLQGQCSASTLPVAWVEEGPGPPHCPESCENLNKKDNFNLNNLLKNNINNKNSNKMENRLNNDDYVKQQQKQCLDYLGDNEQSSPAQICKKSIRDIKTRLKELRLKHCCERSALSALKNDALENVLNGGALCISTLNDLIDTDSLSARITCELNEILVRYDCGQVYSLINHCEDCKEAYRRWVCSTLIPYFAEPNDIRPKHYSNTNSFSINSNSSKTNINNTYNYSNNNSNNKLINIKDRTSSNLEISGDDPLLFKVLKRSRRKSRTETMFRHRIKPCISVCQTVEQKCPYFLPADRAPALPTQYAGEPTFLCLDPNIDETEEEVERSNHGPENCCYTYCGTPSDGVCSYCSSVTNDTDISINQLGNKQQDQVTPESQHCQNILPNSTSSQNPCVIPYYASSKSQKIVFYINNKLSLIKIILIIGLWNKLFNVATWTNIFHQLAGLL